MAEKKEKRYVSDNAQLMQEWNWQKNNSLGIYPEKITYGSSKKVWWICAKNHEWEESPNARTNKKFNCPYCSGKRVIVGENDLSTVRPDLAKEWDIDKNHPITPKDVKEYSNKKVWWICSNGHNWQSTVSNRSVGNGCPICGYQKSAEQRVKAKIDKHGSLESLYPELALEWDYNKNSILPKDVLPSSNKKVWWICSNSHSYSMRISHRKDEHGCPYCSNTKILTGFNDLETWCKQSGDKTLQRWDYEKNNTIIKPRDIAKSSKKIVWWKCNICGYEYKNKVANEVSNLYCPKCNRRNKTSFPEQVIFYYIKKQFPDAINGYRNTSLGISELDIYISSIKTGIEYDGKAWHRGMDSIRKERQKYKACLKNKIKLIRFREAQIEESEAIADEILYSSYQEDMCLFNNEIDSFMQRYNTNLSVDIERDRMEIYDNYLSVVKSNSLENLFPDVSIEWDYKKNHPIKPNMVPAFSNEKFWFLCSAGHSYLTEISKRTTRGDACPICSGRQVLEGFNDLSTTHPELCNEWDYEKNPFPPTSISRGYDKKVWWKCAMCGISFYVSPNTRTSQGVGCAICNGGVSKKVNQYALDGSFVEIYQSCSQAAKIMKVSPTLISRACKEHTIACNFQWRYFEEKNIGGIEPYVKKIFNNKPVNQYSLDGLFIKRHESVTLAQKETGASKIGEVCNGNRKQSGGYLWRYAEK